jgi:integrase/recombinase XerD
MKHNKIELENTKTETTIIEAFSFFKNYLSLNGKAASTANAYATDVVSFLDFMKEFHKNKYRTVSDIDYLLVLKYTEHLSSLVKNQNMKGSTAERRLVSLKVFLKYIDDLYQVKNHITDNPMFKKGTFKKMELRQKDSSADDYYVLSVYDIKKLLDTVLSSNHFNMIRDYAIFQILLSTGCRRSELIKLIWNDVNFDKNEIIITRIKTSNHNKLKLTEDAKEALKTLYYSFGNIPVGKDFIFKGNTQSNNHISDDAYSKTIKRWAKKAGLPDNITGHSFRHYFITSLLEEGISPNEIINYTGHSEVDGLKPYIHLSSFACTNIVHVLNSRNQETL